MDWSRRRELAVFRFTATATLLTFSSLPSCPRGSHWCCSYTFTRSSLSLFTSCVSGMVLLLDKMGLSCRRCERVALALNRKKERREGRTEEKAKQKDQIRFVGHESRRTFTMSFGESAALSPDSHPRFPHERSLFSLTHSHCFCC